MLLAPLCVGQGGINSFDLKGLQGKWWPQGKARFQFRLEGGGRSASSLVAGAEMNRSSPWAGPAGPEESPTWGRRGGTKVLVSRNGPPKRVLKRSWGSRSVCSPVDSRPKDTNKCLVGVQKKQKQAVGVSVVSGVHLSGRWHLEWRTCKHQGTEVPSVQCLKSFIPDLCLHLMHPHPLNLNFCPPLFLSPSFAPRTSLRPSLCHQTLCSLPKKLQSGFFLFYFGYTGPSLLRADFP